MKMGVTKKLFLAILTAAVLAVICSALIMQWSVNRGFLKFVSAMEQSEVAILAEKLEQQYRLENSWDSLRADPERWHVLITTAHHKQTSPAHMNEPPAPPPEHTPEDLHGPPPMMHHFHERLLLLDVNKKVLVGRGGVPIDIETTPLLFQGKTVGYLGLVPRRGASDAPQQRFLQEQKLTSLLIAGVIVLLSALLSLLLARRLVQPLNEIARATHQLAAGIFKTRVAVSSRDELGQLAKDFNSLALALENSDETRRQWVADISHELRTPLTVLRCEIEALQDGIRQPDQHTMDSLHGEVIRLSRLVDDLYQLSLSDVGALTYRKSDISVSGILRENIAAYRSKFTSKAVELHTNIEGQDSTTVFGDPERLHQLFANIRENALKYTDSGGRLQIELEQRNDSVHIDFKDSTPGVAQSDLERLFERLYRVESSRNRSSGGAGLGLAICRNIVTAHGGIIYALPSPLGGIWIHIELPETAKY